MLVKHEGRNISEVEGVLGYAPDQGMYYVGSHTQYGHAITPIYSDYSIVVEMDDKIKIDIDLSASTNKWHMQVIELGDTQQQPDLWGDF